MGKIKGLEFWTLYRGLEMGDKTKDSYQAWRAEDHLHPSATEVKSHVHSFLTGELIL